MKAHEADELGRQISILVQANQSVKAYALLTPILAERTPFRMLDRIGAAVGAGPVEAVNPFLERIATPGLRAAGWLLLKPWANN